MHLPLIELSWTAKNKNTSHRTLNTRGQCYFCRMCPSQQFWQGDYLSTSCQNVAISSDPGRVAQMIQPNIRSASVSDDTLSRHTALVPPKSNTEALYNLLMSHKVGQRWGQRRRSGFRFCWLIRFWRGVFVWDRVALRLVNYFEKRVVRRSWFEIGDSSLTDRTGEGGADHLEQRRSNPLIIGKKKMASDCHRDHHHHDCQQDHKQGHQKPRSLSKETGQQKKNKACAQQCDHLLKMSDWIANKYRC